MQKYHQRRPNQAIDDPKEQLEIIRLGKHMTLAICHADEPYLVTVNFGYEESSRTFFFHCSQAGKKIEFLRSNPIVWGQIIDDLGYQDGQCQHTFRTVQFRGEVAFIEDFDEKRRALHLMIEQLEKNPEPVKKRFVTDKSVRDVVIASIKVEEFSGKRSKIDE